MTARIDAPGAAAPPASVRAQGTGCVEARSGHPRCAFEGGQARRLSARTVAAGLVMVDFPWSQPLCAFSRPQDRCCGRSVPGALPEG